MKDLAKLDKLESLNLTETKVNKMESSSCERKPSIKRIYLFDGR